MRFLFVLIFSMCVVTANAATMCVPDLSTCDSCTDFETRGQLFWSANCCGVPVSGWWIGYGENVRSVDIDTLYSDSLRSGTGVMGYNLCVMMTPFVAPYAVNVEYTWLSSSWVCDGFIPRCAVTYCDETLSQGNGGAWGGQDGY